MANRPIDATMLSAYAKCPRSFYFRHVQHWGAKENPSGAIEFGTAWHAAMDVAWPMIFAGQPAEPITVAAYHAFQASRKVLALPPYDDTTAYSLLREYVNKAIAQRETGRDIWNGQILGIEMPFVIPLTVDGETYDYCGVIDKVILLPNGTVVPVDHKTTAKYAVQGGFRMDFRDGFSPRGQFIGYAYACSLLYGKRVPYVLVDAQLAHKTAVHQEFMPITVTPTEIGEWMDDVAHTIKRIRAAEVSGAYEKLGPMNDACHGGLSGFACAYKPLCVGDFPWKSGVMPVGLYEERKWEPVGGQGEAKN